MTLLTAVGLMSGTSMDGIDAAVIRTDGEGRVERLGFLSEPYSHGFRQSLRNVLGRTEASEVAAVAEALTHLHANAIQKILKRIVVSFDEITIIGFHGHTVAHRPEQGRTWQIGDGALLARLTGRDVVSDFRSADMAAGGQGAPLAPVYHAALAAGLGRPLAVLNLGGVGNVTWIGRDGSLLAFDTGPGNALVDDWMRHQAGLEMDRDGAAAASGSVRDVVLAAMLKHPYFEAAPPKSLDRDDFTVLPAHGLSLEDGAATLTAFTVEAVRRALPHLPAPPRRWVVSGGGRRNPVIMAGLGAALGVPVEPVEAVGWNGDALEAEAFAYMAVRHLKGLPLSFPGTTGVPAPQTGGRLHRA